MSFMGLKQLRNDDYNIEYIFDKTGKKVGQKPLKYAQILIIADDLVRMSDQGLNQLCKQTLHNTVKECNLIPDLIKETSMTNRHRLSYSINSNLFLADMLASQIGKHVDNLEYSYKLSNLDRVEKLINKNIDHMQRLIWDNTDYSVQANLFDDIYEPENITVFDYLMQPKHLVVTVTQMKEILTFLRKTSLEFHLSRGLEIPINKLNLIRSRRAEMESLTEINAKSFNLQLHESTSRQMVS